MVVKLRKAPRFRTHYVHNAIKVCKWYRHQFRLIFNPKLALEKTAQQVVDTLFEILLRDGGIDVEFQFFMKRVPNHVRKKEKFEPVRQWLEDNHVLKFYRKVEKSGRETGPEYVTFHVSSKESKELSIRKGRSQWNR